MQKGSVLRDSNGRFSIRPDPNDQKSPLKMGYIDDFDEKEDEEADPFSLFKQEMDNNLKQSTLQTILHRDGKLKLSIYHPNSVVKISDRTHTEEKSFEMNDFTVGLKSEKMK